MAASSNCQQAAVFIIKQFRDSSYAIRIAMEDAHCVLTTSASQTVLEPPNSNLELALSNASEVLFHCPAKYSVSAAIAHKLIRALEH